jgi:hypothetical protein
VTSPLGRAFFHLPASNDYAGAIQFLLLMPALSGDNVGKDQDPA